MLRELDRILILEEQVKYGKEFILKPVDFSIERILRKYNAYCITEHWYDSDPPECDNCLKDSCKDCDIYAKWENSYERLSRETWVDLWDVGSWGFSQQEVNDLARRFLIEWIGHQCGHKERLFYYKPDPDTINIFYYGRDKELSDYWFEFIKKGKNPYGRCDDNLDERDGNNN